MSCSLWAKFSRFLVVGMLCCVGGAVSGADLALFGPTPYRDPATDLPAGFLTSLVGCGYSLEDFEDGNLGFGITIDTGAVGNPDRASGFPRLTDSVDIDDGVVDGTGQSDVTLTRGYSYYNQNASSFLVMFDSLVTSAGLVWTDGDILLTNVVFEVFDENMNLLGTIDAGDLSDDSYQGTTPEDRFFGATYGDGQTTGIKAIRIANNGGGIGIEIDHIQFERCQLIPEPGSLVLAVLGGLLVLTGRRRLSSAQ